MTARELAAAITANCERYHAGEISTKTWDREQGRLWGMAAVQGVAADVMHIVAPSGHTTAADDAERRRKADAMNARCGFVGNAETYICWNCHSTVTYGRTHACDTEYI